MTTASDIELHLAKDHHLELRAFWGERLLHAETFADPEALRIPEPFPPLLPSERAELSRTGRLLLEAGGLSLQLRTRQAPPPIRTSMEDRDFHFFKLCSITLLVGLALVAHWALNPLSAAEVEELFKPAAASAVRAVTPTIIDVTPPKPTKVASAPKAPKPEGKVGTETGKVADAARSRKAGAVHEKGLLKAFKELGAGASSVFERGGLGGGIEEAMGKLQGSTKLGATEGFGGLGVRGRDPGGGGPDGMGWDGPLGRGGPGRDPSGGIEGGLRERKRTAVPGVLKMEAGGLPREEILRVVRRHQSEVKFCYESALQRDPSLSGKVALLWVIGPTGDVVEAKIAETSLPSDAVGECLVERVGKWRFPEPKDGGQVTVTFPWVFKAAGEGE